jgi:hypothetical protein
VGQTIGAFVVQTLGVGHTGQTTGFLVVHGEKVGQILAG